MTPDIDYRRATQRLFRIAVALALVGTLIAAFSRGLPGALGFALGSGASVLSLSLWRRVAEKLSRAAEPANSGPSRAFLVARFLAFFACAYAIVKTLDVNVMAAICGLFVSAAAVVGEILFQLVTFRHWRSR